MIFPCRCCHLGLMSTLLPKKTYACLALYSASKRKDSFRLDAVKDNFLSAVAVGHVWLCTI